MISVMQRMRLRMLLGVVFDHSWSFALFLPDVIQLDVS